MTIGEPYVYSYHAQNYTQLRDAVHRAFNTRMSTDDEDPPLYHAAQGCRLGRPWWGYAFTTQRMHHWLRPEELPVCPLSGPCG